jgi:hypothetical protein
MMIPPPRFRQPVPGGQVKCTHLPKSQRRYPIPLQRNVPLMQSAADGVVDGDGVGVTGTGWVVTSGGVAVAAGVKVTGIGAVETSGGVAVGLGVGDAGGVGVGSCAPAPNRDGPARLSPNRPAASPDSTRRRDRPVARVLVIAPKRSSFKSTTPWIRSTGHAASIRRAIVRGGARRDCSCPCPSAYRRATGNRLCTEPA